MKQSNGKTVLILETKRNRECIMVKTYITRNDEMILLAILKLGEGAYLVSIRDYLNESTRQKWSIGNLFVAFEKLESTGYITADIGKPSSKRGGKAKKFYSVTKFGIQALKTVKSVQDGLWNDMYDYVFSS